MKRLICAGIVACLGVLVAGCTTSRGLNIVGLIEDSKTRGVETRAVVAMRERYIYTFPFQREIQVLFAQDDAGNVIEEGVEWSTDNPALGTLGDSEGGDPACRQFFPAGWGETTVTATNGMDTDTARIVVYPGIEITGKPRGINLAMGNIVYNEADADIWWPSGDNADTIRFEAGYFTKPYDPEHQPSLTGMDELTADWGEIGPPGDYKYCTDYDQLFLVKARDGAVYSAIVTRGFIRYKTTPVVSAPAP